jgi:hypothetical protein
MPLPCSLCGRNNTRHHNCQRVTSWRLDTLSKGECVWLGVVITLLLGFVIRVLS